MVEWCSSSRPKSVKQRILALNRFNSSGKTQDDARKSRKRVGNAGSPVSPLRSPLSPFTSRMSLADRPASRLTRPSTSSDRLGD